MNNTMRRLLIAGSVWVIVWAMIAVLLFGEAGWPSAAGLAAAIIMALAPVVHLVFFLSDRLPSTAYRAVFLPVIVLVWAPAAHLWLGRAAGMTQPFAQDLLNIAVVTAVAFTGRAAWRGHKNRRLLADEHALRRSAELNALTAHLAPHTLFNQLNTIYAVVMVDPKQGAQLILALSDMMRYLTDQADSTAAALEDEIHFMRCTADLANARAANGSRIDLFVEGDPDIRMPAMLCAPLFENALKHGRSIEGQLNIIARLTIGESALRFEVENKVDPRYQSPARKGAGLSILRQRLERLYPEGYTLQSGLRDDGWSAILEVNLT